MIVMITPIASSTRKSSHDSFPPIHHGADIGLMNGAD